MSNRIHISNFDDDDFDDDGEDLSAAEALDRAKAIGRRAERERAESRGRASDAAASMKARFDALAVGAFARFNNPPQSRKLGEDD
jgi:hypothetical protein